MLKNSWERNSLISTILNCLLHLMTYSLPVCVFFCQKLCNIYMYNLMTDLYFIFRSCIRKQRVKCELCSLPINIYLKYNWLMQITHLIITINEYRRIIIILKLFFRTLKPAPDFNPSVVSNCIFSFIFLKIPIILMIIKIMLHEFHWKMKPDIKRFFLQLWRHWWFFF